MKKVYATIILSITCIATVSAQWTELGTGAHALSANGYIYGVVTDAAGNVYAAGTFQNGASNEYVAKWDGTNWTELGTGNNALNANDEIRSMAIDPSGNIYVGGYFYDLPSNTWYVAKWNGSAWSQLGSLGANSYIYAVTTDTHGNVYAAGEFTDANNKYYVSKWDGAAWHTLGAGTGALNANGNIRALTVDASGNVYAAGYFVNGSSKSYVAKYTPADSSWHELAGSHPLNAQAAYDYIYAVTTDPAGNVYAAGGFANANNQQYVAKWNGTDWTELGVGANALRANDFIYTLTTDASGDVYAAGRFTDTSAYPYVAKWNGTHWSEVTKGTDSLRANDYIYSLDLSHDGSLFAGGFFEDTTNRQFVAKFSATNTAIQDINSSLTGVSIFPNPSAGRVTVNLTDESLIGADIIVTDLIGKTIAEEKLTSYHQQLNLSEAPKGMYLIIIRNDATRISRKIVIE